MRSSRSLAGCLSLVFAFGLSACGGKSTPSAPSTTSASTPAPPPATGKMEVVDLEVGRDFAADKHVSIQTLVFKPGEKLCFAVVTEGSGQNLELSILSTDPGGRPIFEEKRSVSSSGGRSVVTTFELPAQPPVPRLRYAVRATIGTSSLVREFEIK